MRIGLLSFGGPAGQIAVMYRILVEERRWIDEPRFLHALNFCMLLPGPEAQQLATYVGWILHGTRGGLIAGLLFILPGFLTMLALSYIYVLVGQHALIAGALVGLKAAVIALVLDSLIRIARRTLTDVFRRAIAVLAFVALAVFGVPFPWIVVAAGIAGWLATRRAPVASPSVTAGTATTPSPPSLARSAKLLAIWLPLWALPVIVSLVLAGQDSIYTGIGVFFSKMSVVTFGGAYAALAYVAQQAVERFAWLTPVQMMDGLGLAESTPGPLILVLQFVGFLAAYQAAGSLPPLLAGTLGAILTAWVTFVPCFLWIFLGAPHVERLRAHVGLSGTLSAITAAVVGVIANLAVWFALHFLFARSIPVTLRFGHFELPEAGSLQPVSLALTALAILVLFGLRRGLPTTLAVCVLGGAIAHLTGCQMASIIDAASSGLPTP